MFYLCFFFLYSTLNLSKDITTVESKNCFAYPWGIRIAFAPKYTYLSIILSRVNYLQVMQGLFHLFMA